MKITLKIDGKDKDFTTDFISGRVLRRALEISNETNLSRISLDAMDKLVDFVVDVFGKQFTRDQFYDGIPAVGMMKQIISIINDIINSAADSVGADESDPNSQQKA